jgi:hypothetical protein
MSRNKMPSIKQIVEDLRAKGELDEEKLKHFKAWRERQKVLAKRIAIGYVIFCIALLFKSVVVGAANVLVLVVGYFIFKNAKQNKLLIIYNYHKKIEAKILDSYTSLGASGCLKHVYFEYEVDGITYGTYSCSIFRGVPFSLKNYKPSISQYNTITIVYNPAAPEEWHVHFPLHENFKLTKS